MVTMMSWPIGDHACSGSLRSTRLGHTPRPERRAGRHERSARLPRTRDSPGRSWRQRRWVGFATRRRARAPGSDRSKGLGSREGQGGWPRRPSRSRRSMVFFFNRVVFHGGASSRSIAWLHARVHDCYLHVFPTQMGPIGRKIGNLGH
jgi:hypothetical protein